MKNLTLSDRLQEAWYNSQEREGEEEEEDGEIWDIHKC